MSRRVGSMMMPLHFQCFTVYTRLEKSLIFVENFPTHRFLERNSCATTMVVNSKSRSMVSAVALSTGSSRYCLEGAI